jgi:hypothetical protein
MNEPHISASLRRKLAEESRHRCGYCLTTEANTGIPMTVDHIIPRAKGGKTTLANLWLACYRCNEFKGARTQAEDPLTGENVPLFNPRTQVWTEHFAWSADGTQIIGLTAVGRATVIALRMNDALRVTARRRWVSVGWHPPKD